MKTVGGRLRKARQSSHLLQSQAARKIRRDPSLWSRWEANTARLSMLDLLRINKLLGVSLDWLLLGVDLGSPEHQRLLFLILKLPDREVVKLVEWLEVRLSG